MLSQLADVTATERFGAQLGEALLAAQLTDSLILFDGDLGAGKTTMVRGLIHGLGHVGRVPSPTYTLLEPYTIGALPLCHLDLYRLAEASELEHLGWRDLGGTLRLVEWSSRAPELARAADLRVALSLSGNGRQVRVEALSARAESVIDHLNAISR
ncbi:MAG: tRNA (adenosine(37)-N6)-threonylcarbamoyltransferase complex ATPase subunit type 1 TsaE [Pseudomonadota bacterium]